MGDRAVETRNNEVWNSALLLWDTVVNLWEELNKPIEVISMDARIDCETRIRAPEHFSLERKITIPLIKNESSEDTLKRFKSAAEDLTRVLGGCYRKKLLSLINREKS